MLSQTHRSTTTTTVSSSPLRRHHHHHEMDGAVFEKKKRGGDELEDEFDDFLVDELLNFPEANEFESETVGCDGSGGGGIESLPCVSVKFDGVVTATVSSFDFSQTEISVPADDVAELEWLSRFVDDSFTEYSLAYSGANLVKPGSLTPATVDGGRLLPKPAKKPRGKRSRSTGNSWSRSASDTTSSSSSSGSTSTLTSSPKRQRRTLDGGVRRCSHCGVQKTPQWRAGPEGAKTLCNACGVRFKSGRLCPEYRPACSPTFCSKLHSNKHRKVVEMRQRKEAGTTAVSCLAPAV